MDHMELDRIGSRLREIGHHRREVVERIVAQLEQRDAMEVKHLYGKLSELSSEAMDLMQHQREYLEHEVGVLHLPGQPGHPAADRI